MSDRTPRDWAQHFSRLASRPGPGAGLDLELPRYNPRPAGVIRPGSASDAVLKLLQAHPGRWFSYHQIMQATGRTPKSVDWALLFLKTRGLIESTRDEWRNSRYLKYSIAQPKDAVVR